MELHFKFPEEQVIEKAVNASFERFAREILQPILMTQMRSQHSMQEMMRDVIGAMQDRDDPLLSEIASMRRTLSRQPKRLEDSLSESMKSMKRSMSAKLASKPEPKRSTTSPALLKRIDALKEAVVSSRPKTYAVMNG